jgi:hypothetical protein
MTEGGTMTEASARGTVTKMRQKQPRNGPTRDAPGGEGRYVLPVVHVSLPETAVNVGFWSALATSAALGVVDPPLAALIGAGVLIARHQRSN